MDTARLSKRLNEIEFKLFSMKYVDPRRPALEQERDAIKRKLQRIIR